MGCGQDTTLTALIADKAVNEAVDNGKVQGGLQDCNGQPLRAGAKVQSCEAAAADKTELQRAVENAERKAADGDKALSDKIAALTDTVPTSLELTRDDKLRVGLSNGEAVEADVSGLMSDTKPVSGAYDRDTRQLTLALSDGSNVAIDLCGVGGKPPCAYYATVQVKLRADGCDQFSRVAWAYHNEDFRDPAATNRLTDCEGNVIAWLYPEYEHGRIAIETEGGTVAGYALPAPVSFVEKTDCTPCANTKG